MLQSGFRYLLAHSVYFTKLQSRSEICYQYHTGFKVSEVCNIAKNVVAKKLCVFQFGEISSTLRLHGDYKGPLLATVSQFMLICSFVTIRLKQMTHELVQSRCVAANYFKV
jgi:hypothetical protein